MKKILVFGASLMIGVGALGMASKVRVADATNLSDEQVTALKAMMNKYIDSQGRYTKKSSIYLDTNNVDFETGYFHANHAIQQRTTYYAPGALLMGDLDGGFTNINSGYANDGEGNMIHFRSEDGIAGLTSDNRTIDYTVTGKTMTDYFFTLPDLVDSIVAGDWGYNDGNYYHDILDLTLDENNEYNDKLLKKFQYFAAPMLLQDGALHYLSPKSIVINDVGGYLHISLYASESDSGKLTSGSNLLAEARVYSGLVTPGYYLVGSFGGSYDWQLSGGRAMPASGENHAQIENVSLGSGSYQICQLKDNGDTAWFNALGTTYYFAEKVGNDISIKFDGNYNFYLNSSDEIYLVRNDYKTVLFTFTYDDSSWSSWDPRPYGFRIHLTDNQKGVCGTWGSDDELFIKNNNNYTISVHFNGSVTGVFFYFYQDGVDKKTNNILGTTLINDKDSYTVNVDTSAFVWSGNEITSGITISAL